MLGLVALGILLSYQDSGKSARNLRYKTGRESPQMTRGHPGRIAGSATLLISNCRIRTMALVAGYERLGSYVLRIAIGLNRPLLHYVCDTNWTIHIGMLYT